MKLDLSKSFNKFILIIRKSVIDGIKKGSQFDKAFKPNEDSTIKQKGHNQPLQGKGRRGDWLKPKAYKIKKATTTEQSASIEVPKARIALINQTSKTHPRPFWGVSKRASDSMNKSVNYDINKYVNASLIEAGFKKV